MPKSGHARAVTGTSRPRLAAAPHDLVPKGRGRRFWRRIVVDIELAPVELELLAETCRVLDRLESLRIPAGADPKLLIEERQQRIVLGRLLGQLALPVPRDEGGLEERGETGMLSGASVRGSRAASARWKVFSGSA